MLNTFLFLKYHLSHLLFAVFIFLYAHTTHADELNKDEDWTRSPCVHYGGQTTQVCRCIYSLPYDGYLNAFILMMKINPPSKEDLLKAIALLTHAQAVCDGVNDGYRQRLQTVLKGRYFRKNVQG